MVVVTDRVIVDLEARVQNYERNVARATQRFDRGMRKIEGSARRMEGRVEGSMSRAGAAVRRHLGFAAAVLGTREIGLPS